MIVLCTSIMMLHEIHLQGSTSAGVFFQWYSQQNYLLCPGTKNFIRSLDKAYSIKYPIHRTYIRVQQLNKLPRSTSDLHIRGCARPCGTTFCTAGRFASKDV